MTDQWTAFVNARLDEWEQSAKAAGKFYRPTWRVDRKPWVTNGTGVVDPIGESVGVAVGDHVAEHIAANDPAFVLGWVEQLRKILALHTPDTSRLVKEPFCVCQDDDGVVHGEWPCETVRFLAAIWAVDTDHPEFREEAR